MFIILKKDKLQLLGISVIMFFDYFVKIQFETFYEMRLFYELIFGYFVIQFYSNLNILC